MSVVAVLSAYREADGEFAKRDEAAQRLPGRKVYPLGQHTRKEADQVLNWCPGELDIRVVTSGYHAERAFLTFIQALKDRGLDQSVLVRVVATEESQTPMIERDKIRLYQERGDVASYAEGDSYVAHWMLKILCATS
jgi:hypothetical protein